MKTPSTKKTTARQYANKLKKLEIGNDVIFPKSDFNIVHEEALKLEKTHEMHFDVSERYDKFSAIRIQ